MNYVATLMKQMVDQFAQLGHETLYQRVLERGSEMQIEPLTFEQARIVAQLARQRGGINAFKTKEC